MGLMKPFFVQAVKGVKKCITEEKCERVIDEWSD